MSKNNSPVTIFPDTNVLVDLLLMSYAENYRHIFGMDISKYSAT